MTIHIQKIAQNRWAIFFSFLSLFLLGLADNIRGPLFPEIINYFSLSSAKGSLSFATTSTAAFFGSYLSGHYLKKFSISSLLALSIFIMSAGLVIMGTSVNFKILIVGSFIFGLSFGFLAVAQNLLVSENSHPKNRSKILSGLHAMYGFASFLAPLFAAGVTVYFNGWRAAFLLTACLCFLFVIVQLLFPPNPHFTISKNISNTSEQSNARISKLAQLMIGGLLGFYVVAEILVSTRLAQYMRTYFLMDLQSSSQYVTYFFLFLLAGRLFFAFNKINSSFRLQMNVSLGLSIIFLILGLNIHPFFLALVGLSMAPFYPLSIAYISEMTGIHSRVFITFAMSFQSLLVIGMHLGVGYITDQLGLFYAFGVGIFALVLSSICLNLHPKKLTY